METLPSRGKVMIVGDKENDYLTVMFACLKSGRAYVPISASLPKERALFIKEHSEVVLLIYLSGSDSFFGETEVIYPKELQNILHQWAGSEVQEDHWLKYNDMMALLYTSGSTGSPKGVMNALGDLENLFLAPEEYYIGGEGARVMNNFSYMFSAHMQHVYRTMVLMGSTLFAVPAEDQKDPVKLMDRYLNVQPEYLGLIATSCSMLLSDHRFSAKYLPSLKAIALAGEVCSRTLVEELFRRFPGISVKIQYASTELTTVAIGCTLTKETMGLLKEEKIPIGIPVPSIRAEVWDEKGSQVPEGDKGELVIFADRLCEGYYKLPEETKAAFFLEERGKRGYRTKDLMMMKEGYFYYLGRMDNRIKIGGNRVELEEVEGMLNKVEAVEQSVVRPVSDKDGAVKYLVAYLTLRCKPENETKQLLEIRKKLKEKLPSYMIPQKITILNTFPKNSSGKIDRYAMRLYHDRLYPSGE